jgi:hypothetical protein
MRADRVMAAGEESRSRGLKADDFWGGWPVAEGRVGPFPVVLLAPALDQDPGFGDGVEDLAVQQFIPEAGVEGLHISITGHDRAGARVSRHVGVAAYGATIRDTGHREHVECGQAVRWK